MINITFRYLSIENYMHHILFLVCPFSCLEQPLKQRYGKQHLFLTAPAAVFGWSQVDHLLAIRDVLVQQEIREICVVADTSCRFIHAVIQKDKPFGLSAEKILIELYIDNYFRYFKDQAIENQRDQLAKLIVQRQLDELIAVPFIGGCIQENAIAVNGLVSSSRNFFKAISLKPTQPINYGL